MSVPTDPITADGIAGFGRRLRAGETTAVAATEAYLHRIAALDPRIGAYEFVDAAGALNAARAIDAVLAAGTDLGPLMGVPVAVKDLIAVEGMPVTAGSHIDVSDLIGPEGDFVRRLRRAGCVILGKTRTIEFAFGGASGYNAVRGTPWNPWDGEVHRGPGGSSSGSGAAVAAGLAAFAIGTDTGGSVRIPAALCGLAGLKPSVGVWPTDGVFPLCSTFDTLGLLARSAADLAVAFAALTCTQVVEALPVRGLRLGRPRRHFFEDLDAVVAASIEDALARLASAGAVIEPVDSPAAEKPETFFHGIVPTEFIASFGRERFARVRGDLDPATAARGAMGLSVTADEYVRLLRLHRMLAREATVRSAGFDAWIAPTVSMVAPEIAAFDDVDRGLHINIEIGRLTRPVNVFGMATTTTPVPGVGTDLPVGLQLMVPNGRDHKLIAAAGALETVFGLPSMPDLAPFGG